MEKFFVDVKEFSKGRYTRSHYIEEQQTEQLRRAPIMP